MAEYVSSGSWRASEPESRELPVAINREDLNNEKYRVYVLPRLVEEAFRAARYDFVPDGDAFAQAQEIGIVTVASKEEPLSAPEGIGATEQDSDSSESGGDSPDVKYRIAKGWGLGGLAVVDYPGDRGVSRGWGR